MDAITSSALETLNEVEDILVLYAIRNNILIEIEFTERFSNLEDRDNQDYFLGLYFRDLQLTDPETAEALADIKGEEREWIISYLRDGLANFKFRDKIIELYKSLFPSQEDRVHHIEEMRDVVKALEARISELE